MKYLQGFCTGRRYQVIRVILASISIALCILLFGIALGIVVGLIAHIVNL